MRFRLNKHRLLVLWCSALFTAHSGSVISAESLESLPQAVQDEIGTLCLPLQYREGAAAYRDCVQSEIALRNPALTQSSDANPLAQLSFDDKYAVQQACASTGAQSSATYRQCAIEQIADLKRHPVPVLQGISEDEQYAIQQSCFSAQSTLGAGAYRQCVNEQIQSLQQIPAVDTAQLNMLDKNALQLRCSANTQTAADYRRCVAAEYASIVGSNPVFKSAEQAPLDTTEQTLVPADDAPAVSELSADKFALDSDQNESLNDGLDVQSTASVATVNATQQNATVENITPEQETIVVAQTDTIKDAQTTLAEAPAAALEDTNAQITEPANPDTSLALPRNIEPQRASNNTSPITVADAQQTNTAAIDTTVSSSDDNSRVISKPALVSALEEQQRTRDLAGDAAGNETVVGDEPRKQSADNNSAGSVGEAPVDGQTGGAFGDVINNVLASAKSAFGSLSGMHWTIIAALCAVPLLLFSLRSVVRSVRRREPAPDLAATAASLQEMDRRHEYGHGRDGLQESVHDDTAIDDDGLLGDTLEFEDRNGPAVTMFAEKTAAGSPTDRITFDAWLQTQPAELRMQHCIEFLVYWMAYGDKRFDPALLETLLSLPEHELHEHELIKRRVLEQDTTAFTEVVIWMRKNASGEQLEQTVALLGTLLISENAVSPVQNTLMRFLSDVFGLGKEQLENSFAENFGHELPPMPRADLLAWWQKQSFTSVQRWDSRAMANRSEHEQMMARLGLSDDFNEQSVIAAFRRGSRRCHPDRYNALGPRERALAEKQFSKFEQARDILLGVSV